MKPQKKILKRALFSTASRRRHIAGVAFGQMGAGASGRFQNKEYAAFNEAWGSPDKLKALWAQLDVNGSNLVSLAEIDKLVVEDPRFEGLNNKPALLRAYYATCAGGGCPGVSCTGTAGVPSRSSSLAPPATNTRRIFSIRICTRQMTEKTRTYTPKALGST